MVICRQFGELNVVAIENFFTIVNFTCSFSVRFSHGFQAGCAFVES